MTRRPGLDSDLGEEYSQAFAEWCVSGDSGAWDSALADAIGEE